MKIQGPAITLNCCWVLPLPGICTVLDYSFRVRLGALQKYYVLLRCECLPPLWITIRRTSSRQFRCWGAAMSGWVCQWKPFWIPVEDSFKKAYLDDWAFISDVASEGPSSTDQGEVIPETPRMSNLASSLLWEPAKLHDKACFWERIEAPLLPLRPRPKGDFIHPRQLSPFPEAFGTAVFDRGFLVTLRRNQLLRKRSLYFMDQTERTRNPGRTYGGHWEGHSRFSQDIWWKRHYFFSLEKFKKTLCDPFDCAKEKGRCLRTTN